MRVLPCHKLIVLIAIGFLSVACNQGAPAANSTNSTPAANTAAAPSPSPLTDFEEALRFVRNGQYTYIYVISRKDGKPLQPDDSDFLKINAPQFVDKAATKDKMKVVAGTNFNLEEGNLEMLKKRFVIEDYSAR